MIDLMAVWGERWVRRTISREDADAAWLMWTVKPLRGHRRGARRPDHRALPLRALPRRPKRCWWLVLQRAAR